MKRMIIMVLSALIPIIGILVAWSSYQLFHRVEGQFFDSNGTRLHYIDEGKGEPVILIHGFAMNIDNTWRISGIIRALSNDYRVVAIDVRGHGLSAKPYESRQYGVEMAQDVVRLMNHLNLDKANVVGHSMGAYITLKLLATYPDRLISATQCSAGWLRLSDEDREIQDALATSLESRSDFRPLFVMLYPEDQKIARLLMWPLQQYLAATNDTKALAAVIRSIDDLEVAEEELRKNTVPTLSVVGSRDPFRIQVERMTGVMNNHRAIIIDGANHRSVLGPKFVKLLKAFIQEHN